MLLLVLGGNMLFTFVGWEGVGACSYWLVAFWFERDAAASAGKKAFIYNRIGDVGFLLAMFLIFEKTGSLDYSVDIRPSRVVRSGSGHGGVPPAVPRCGGQVGPDPALPMACGRDGGPDPGLGPDPRGDDGDVGCLSAVPDEPVCSPCRTTRRS